MAWSTTRNKYGSAVMATSLGLRRLFHRGTRSHPLTLTTRTSTINAYEYSFFTNVAFIWNKIPYDILSITSPIAFKLRLRQYLFYN